MVYENDEKVKLLILLLKEATSSQDLGEVVSDVMDVDEEDLWEITNFGVKILEEKLK